VQAAVVSANFFDLLGVRPRLGRSFAGSDEQAGAAPVVVLSDDYWRRSQRADPSVVGQSLKLNGRVFTVIGVLPPLPPYPDANDLYMTTTSSAFRMWPDRIGNRNRRFARVFARLAAGATLGQTNRDLAAVAARLANAYPASYPPASGYRAIAVPVREEVSRRAGPSLWLLTGGALFILAIACANVANLTLARLAEREHELATRVALGAGAARLFRQLLTEAMMLASVAAALGVLLAIFTIDLVRALFVELTPLAGAVTIDGAALLFAVLVAAATSAATTGLVALSVRYRTGRMAARRQFTANPRQARLRSGLLVAQVTFSFVLLSGAGLMVRSLVNLQRVDDGVARNGVLTMHVDFSAARYAQPADQRAAGRLIVDAANMLPGVVSAAVGSSFPLDPSAIAFGIRGDWNRYRIEGDRASTAELPPVTALRIVSTEYFATLGIPVLLGRTFQPIDTPAQPRVVVVNRAFARHRLANVDPIGARISSDGGATWLAIVGVVGDTAERDLRDTAADEVYYPIEQLPPTPSGDWVRTLVVRTMVDPASLDGQLRRAIERAAPEVAVSHVLTLDAARANAMTSPRLTTALLSIFGAVALMVAIAGLGGMSMVAVNQRVKEIGIRRALGAQAADVMSIVLRGDLAAVAAGLAAGVILTAIVARSLRTFLFQVAPTDAVTTMVVCGVFGLSAIVACLLPVSRALGIEPSVALRDD